MEQNLSLILQIATLLGLIFGVFLYFKKPQDDIMRNQSLDTLATEKDKLIAEKDLGTKATILAQKELETKALVLVEQVKSKNEENERRFGDMGIRLDAAMTTAQNHIHSIDIKVDKLIETQNSMCNKITELTTIINERIPKK